MWLYGFRKRAIMIGSVLLIILLFPFRSILFRQAGPMFPWPALVILLIITVVIGAVFYRLLAGWWNRRELALAGTPVRRIATAYLGMICGLAVGLLLHPALAAGTSGTGATVLPLMVDLLFGLIGYRIGELKSEEFALWLPREQQPEISERITGVRARTAKHMNSSVKLLDSSAVIDGRVADIRRTGFLDGELIVPDFVIQELQQIADSPDLLKRNRGRRGLDILQQMQREHPQGIRIQEVRAEAGDVDTRLVRLAKSWQAKIVTNDFNLSKVCDLHGVEVLNMNELASVMKPAVLPGEEMRVLILKDGKEQGQGIGYLDDGTMVVVDSGKMAIGQTIDVVVSSVLQTAAGKMIFARRKVIAPEAAGHPAPEGWTEPLRQITM